MFSFLKKSNERKPPTLSSCRYKNLNVLLFQYGLDKNLCNALTLEQQNRNLSVSFRSLGGHPYKQRLCVISQERGPKHRLGKCMKSKC